MIAILKMTQTLSADFNCVAQLNAIIQDFSQKYSKTVNYFFTQLNTRGYALMVAQLLQR